MARYANRDAKRRVLAALRAHGEERRLMFSRLGLLNQLLRRIGVEPPCAWRIVGP